jgi:hypothetical protein
MIMVWFFLFGAAVGCGLALWIILRSFAVISTSTWNEHEQEMNALRSCVKKTEVRNVLLQDELAGEISPTARTTATMTLAALGYRHRDSNRL